LLCFIIIQKYKIETSLKVNDINTFKHFYAQNSMIVSYSVLKFRIGKYGIAKTAVIESIGSMD